MPQLAVLILTKNEEQNIREAIENAMACADEVVIIDSDSTDNTVAIAKEAGAKVVNRAWDNDFAAQRNFALNSTWAEWVLYLDADERLNPELIADIKRVVEEDVPKQFEIVRKTVAFGKMFKHGALRPDTVTRLFRRENVSWVGQVHERPICTDKKNQLKGFIEHYTYDSWEKYLEKMNHYTTIWAADMYDQGKRVSLAGVFGHVANAYVKAVILRLGFLDGFMGIFMCISHAYYTLMKYLKLYNLQRTRSK